MLQSDKLVQPKTATRYFDSFLNLITGPFFGPLVFLFGGAGGGGYIALDNGGAFLSGAISALSSGWSHGSRSAFSVGSAELTAEVVLSFRTVLQLR